MKQALGFPCYLSQLHAATLTEVAPTSSYNTLPMNAIILVLRKHLHSHTQPITDQKLYTVLVKFHQWGYTSIRIFEPDKPRNLKSTAQI
jgi:hypothetical protein